MPISKRKTLTDSLKDLRGGMEAATAPGVDIENEKYKKPFMVPDYNRKKRLTLNDMRDGDELQENMRSIPFENEYENMTKQGTAMMVEFNKRIKLFGFPCYYITARDIKKSQSQIMSRKFNYADAVKLYFLPENLDGWEAEKETLFEQGLGIFDEGTLITTKWLWYEARVKKENIDKLPIRPVEGDLIYHALSQKLYGVRFVDRDMPFYPLGMAPQWNIKIESYEQRNSDTFIGFEGTDTDLGKLFSALENREATIRTVDMSNDRYDKVREDIIEEAKDKGATVTDLLQKPVEKNDDGETATTEDNQNNLDEDYFDFGEDWTKNNY